MDEWFSFVASLDEIDGEEAAQSSLSVSSPSSQFVGRRRLQQFISEPPFNEVSTSDFVKSKERFKRYFKEGLLKFLNEVDTYLISFSEAFSGLLCWPFEMWSMRILQSSTRNTRNSFFRRRVQATRLSNHAFLRIF